MNPALNEKVIKSFVINLVRYGFHVEKWTNQIDFDALAITVIDDLEIENIYLDQILIWIKEICTPENIGEIKYYQNN